MWQFYAIRDGALWFGGTKDGEGVWTADPRLAYPCPTRACAERWVERLAMGTMDIVPVDVDNSTGVTRIVGLSKPSPTRNEGGAVA